MITAILNGFRRSENLDRQIAALRAQTVPPMDIMIWHNNPGEGHSFNLGVSASSVSAYCNANLGVWSRFAYALNARTDYVCVFDDDTIPGPRWFENCLAMMEKRPALLGTVGLLYIDPPPAFSPETSYYTKYIRFGWADGNNNVDPVAVDFVGHAWFFRREWLSVFWREMPNPKYALCGEDMHFSFMLQKYAGIPTIVPPHPPHDPALWGSVHGNELGNDANALWRTNFQMNRGPTNDLMNEYFVTQRRKGWRLVNDR